MTAALLASVLSCGTDDPAAPSAQPLEGTAWNLLTIAVPEGTIDATVLERTPWVGFEREAQQPDSGRVRGFGGCNGFSGNYRQVDSQLTISDLIMTLIGCVDPVARVEGTFLRALGAASSFSVSGETLSVECRGDTALHLSVRIDP